ncbi:MAG: hypothetical protein D6678_02180 [Zetaproteobacteria bacterium]|nr:MAG: hypothetical protein D6678_02180 [Zetaproteobacteria bacterium]
MRGMRREAGFVLPMSLIVLTLLTLLGLGLYFVSRAGVQTSAAAQRATQGFYFAEAGIHYLAWALNHDAELDSYSPGGTYQTSFGEPPFPSNAGSVGDYSELFAYPWYPGPTTIASSGAGKKGQLMYFDNTPMQDRAVCVESSASFSNCIDFSLPPDQRVMPLMDGISARLPRYIKLEMNSSGVISASIPRLPHRSPPVVGEDVPNNGAVVWLTAGTASRDIEIFALDPSSLYGGTQPTACAGGSLPSCPCNAADAAFVQAQACDAHTGQWLNSYGLVAYAIGYVDGHPVSILRAVIM